jgi:hypothetical protein
MIFGAADDEVVEGSAVRQLPGESFVRNRVLQSIPVLRTSGRVARLSGVDGVVTGRDGMDG